MRVINVTLRKVKQKNAKGIRRFLEKELLCHQEVISVEKTLKDGMLLTSDEILWATI
jgi:hypothetical protein